MAIQQSRPFVSTSTLRKIRSGAFARKKTLGPETTKAVISADLEQERLTAKDDADRLARQNAEQAKLEESKRQFDVNAAESRKVRKAAEPDFFTGLFGS